MRSITSRPLEGLPLRAAALGAGVLLAMALPNAMLMGQVKPGFTVTPGSAPVDPTNSLPLKTTRIVRFTTEEGTWMSVDISPDGRTIMFDLLGDIYTMPASGGRATRLLGGNSMDVEPKYSPDGKMIAFISDRSGNDQLWVANADGTDLRQLSSGGGGSDPSWTPDGEYVVTGGMMYHVAGGKGVRVPFAGDGVVFSRDGQRVYYPGYGAIQMYDRTTGLSKTVTSGISPSMRPLVSPDEKTLVYVARYDSRTGLIARDLTTGDERWIRLDVQHDASQRSGAFGNFPNGAWVPNESAILTTFDGKIWKVEVPSGKATLIPFTAEVEQYLGPLSRFDYRIADTFTVRQIRDAKPSPDRKRLAFAALDKIYLTDLTPGARPKRVTKSTLMVEHSPTWSPDGKYVVFATYSDESGGDLYRVNADGSGLKKLTKKPGFYVKPTFTRDGKELVFAAGAWVARRNFVEARGGSFDNGMMQLVRMDAQGGELRPITPVGSMTEQFSALPDATYPHLGPEADRIYYPQNGLYSIQLDGTDKRLHFKNNGLRTLISPNGKWAVSHDERTDRLYAFPVPLVGDTGLTLNLSDTGGVVPFRRVTDLGAEFPGWTQDGKTVYYSLGRSFFMYDVAEAEAAIADSAAKARVRRRAGDTARVAGADTLPNRPAYTPRRYDINVVVPADKPKGVLALRGARIITMKGAEIIENGDLVITDNRITAIGPSGTVGIPNGAKQIDVTGKTIIPGYVDVHSHMLPAFTIHKTGISQLLANLAYGVTTIRDPQTQFSDVVAYGDRGRTGELLGPRNYATGRAVFSEEGIHSLARAREVIRRFGEFLQTETIKQYMSGNRRQRQLIVTATYELGVTPTTEGAGDFKMSITEMLDGYAGHEHAYELYPLYQDVAMLAAASGITYTPTLLVSYGGPEGKHYFFRRERAHEDPKLRRFSFGPDVDQRTRGGSWNSEDEYIFKGVSGGAAAIVAAGGRVGLGSHGELQGLGAHWELFQLASGGMPAHDVLRSATIFGAESIGLSKELGSLEVGKLADLQVLDANPLENIRNISKMKYVMLNGRLYDSNTLDEVWPRQRKLDRQWWWDWGPSAATAVAR